VGVGAELGCVEGDWGAQDSADFREIVFPHLLRLPVVLHGSILYHKQWWVAGLVLLQRANDLHTVVESAGVTAGETTAATSRAEIFALWSCNDHPLRTILDACLHEGSGGAKGDIHGQRGEGIGGGGGWEKRGVLVVEGGDAESGDTLCGQLDVAIEVAQHLDAVA
jgi:hypothetical protein